MKTSIFLQIQHLPGVLNTIADEEYKTWSDRLEWKLSPSPNQSVAGTTIHRPVHRQDIITTLNICELEARPFGSGHGCLHSGLKCPPG